MTEKMSKDVFSDFGEFWFYTKKLTDKQRQAILRTLPKSQRTRLKDSYKKGGWGDLMIRNQLDALLDSIQKEYGCNLLELRMIVCSGRRVFVKKTFWDAVVFQFRGFKPQHTHYIFGDYRHTEGNSPTEYLLVPTEDR